MVKIYTLNCNGLKDPHRVELLKQRLINYKTDICFLQETRVDNMKLARSIENTLDGKMFWSITNNRGKGVGIYISKSLSCKVERFHYDIFGRYVYVDLEIEDRSVRLINIYAPNVPRERKDFFNDLYSIVLCAKPVILGGDFNCVAHLGLDKQGGNRNKGKEGWQELSSLIQDFDLIDCFRSRYPNTKEYTWSGRGVSCRLDRFYISSCLLPAMADIRHILYANSDHKFVALSFASFNHVNVGKPFWKINNSLLQDEDYLGYMKAYLFYRLRAVPTDSALLEWWDEVKVGIKEETVAYTKLKIKRENSELNDLHKEFFRLERQNKQEEAHAVKDKILQIECEKLRGAQIRSKVQLLENGEKPTKFFLRKELARGKRKIIKEVINTEGETCTSSETILDAFKEFYTNLYRKESDETGIMEEFLNDVPSITEEDSKMLGAEINREEIKKALTDMYANKSPGSDGLSKEFYFAFFDQLSPILTKMFQIIHTTGCLGTSQKLSYISLLCKDDDHPELLSNYRPISLLNVDYKIMTKVLCSRLKKVLCQVVHPDQTCAVPGRSIIDSCHLVRDVLDYCNARDMPGVFLSLDQEKAFDRVSHEYLLRALRAFGMGEGFISWIGALYHDISSCVIANHFVSAPFPVTRSVRQGCSLSPLLYVLCLEPVLIKIRNDREIKGFKLPGRKEEQKTTAFADDSNFFLADEKSTRRVIGWFEHFGKGSGAKLNKRKSKGHFFGKWKNRSDHPFGIAWADKIKVFGIWFGNISLGEIWTPVYRKICKTLDLYKGRVMSLYGRAVVVNVMVLSKLWYMASVLCVPERLIELIEREVFKFFWSSKNEMINRGTMFLPKCKGGIGVTNIRFKIICLQLAQVNKIVYDDNTLGWVPFGHVWLGLKLIKFQGYRFSNLMPHCVEDIPIYYQSILDNISMLLAVNPNFSLCKTAKCKNYYKTLLEMADERPKVEGKFPQIDFTKVFNAVSDTFPDPITTNVSFKLAHDVLPVAYRLYMYNMPVCKMCSFCKHDIETVEHLFYFCPYVQMTKKFLARWFKTIDGRGISLECIRFSVFSHDALSIACKKILLVILSEYRFSIWLCRNKVRFDHKRMRSIDIAAHFLARIKIRLWTDFKRMTTDTFISYWTYDGLCSVTDNGLGFHFSLND